MAPRSEVTGKIEAGNYRLYLRSTGNGSPPVVLDGNLRGSSAEWAGLPERIASFTRVCTYDRDGITQPPLSSEQIVADLRALLQATGIEGPYVLVGWAFGAYTVRLYASRFPAEVAGLVLVDGLHEDFFTRYRLVLPPADPSSADPLKDFRYELAGGYRYLADMEASAMQVRAARQPLGNRPLAVITRGDPDWPATLPDEVIERLEQTWQTMQLELAGLSSNSVHIIAPRSGHLIHADRPDIVADAIRRVVVAARGGTPLKGA
jgi:pimeloyl-ACP methyl ester carboxylesterase